METELNPPSLTEPDFREPAVAPEQLTRKQIGQLRRQYLTIVHGTVKQCGHKAKFSKDKAPNSNCVHCWEAYFMTSVDLDGIHAILSTKGAQELIKHRGTKFVRMFHGFLSARLLPALAAETSVESPAMIQGGTFGNGQQGTTVQADISAE